MSECIKLGDIPLDSAQTIRKAWCDSKDGHRTVAVNVDYNIVEHTYNDCGQLSKVEYFHESEAESTKITFTSDCCSDLNGKHFTLFSHNDGTRYKVIYSVCCGTCEPISVGTTRTILVNIQANDPAEVVALATKQAISLDCRAPCDLCISLARDVLTITNKINGEATDVINSCTGFTFEVLSHGAKTSVETLTYVYNTDGRIKTVTTSGSNVLNLNEPFDKTVSIGANGKVTRLSQNNELAVELSPKQNEVLKSIVDELRIMNLHLSLITEENIEKQDLDTKDTL